MKRLNVKTCGIMFDIGKRRLRSPFNISIREHELKLFLMQVKLYTSVQWEIIEEQTSTFDHSSTLDNGIKHQFDVGTGSNNGELTPLSPPNPKSQTYTKRKTTKEKKDKLREDTIANTETTREGNIIIVKNKKLNKIKVKIIHNDKVIKIIEKGEE